MKARDYYKNYWGFSRKVSPVTDLGQYREKEELRERLEADTAAFLAAGGRVQQVAFGTTSGRAVVEG